MPDILIDLPTVIIMCAMFMGLGFEIGMAYAKRKLIK